MREQKWGRIINIASTGSLKGYKYVSRLCRIEACGTGLTRSLALEVATLASLLTRCAQATPIQTLFSKHQNHRRKDGRSEAVA
jgi:NAD(P)-dependent dehydrogenase (short-subunit alcohol dehydrogenase family)